MVKLFSRTFVLLVLIGLGVQEGTLFGMLQNLRQRGSAAQQQTRHANQQIAAVLTRQQKEAARIAELKSKVELYDLSKKAKAIDEEKWDEEVADRAKLLKGLFYGVAVPGTALINYSTGDFGIKQVGSLVILVILTYYGVIHAFIMYLSEGVQHIKQIPVRKAINYVRRSRGNAGSMVNDPLLDAFASDSDSESDSASDSE